MSARTLPEKVPVLLVAVGAADDPVWVRRAVKRSKARGVRRCAHLPRESATPRVVFGDDSELKCWTCATDYANQPAAGPFGEAVDERVACGGCGGAVSVWESRSTVLVAPPLYVALDLCASCVASLQPEEGGGDVVEPR